MDEGRQGQEKMKQESRRAWQNGKQRQGPFHAKSIHARHCASLSAVHCNSFARCQYFFPSGVSALVFLELHGFAIPCDLAALLLWGVSESNKHDLGQRRHVINGQQCKRREGKPPRERGRMHAERSIMARAAIAATCAACACTSQEACGAASANARPVAAATIDQLGFMSNGCRPQCKGRGKNPK